MQFKINSTMFLLTFLTLCIYWASCEESSLSCNSCGEECTDACGTRHFRTCCFNYLKKRNGPPSVVHDKQQKLLTANEIEKVIYLLTLMKQNSGKIPNDIQEYLRLYDRSQSRAFQLDDPARPLYDI